MQIEKSSQGDLLELAVRGRLDNDSSIYFRDEIESYTREGWHRILVDLQAVTYLSSSGIAALLDAKKRMDRLSGFFGIHNASAAVEDVLRLTRLFDTLHCDPHKARSGPGQSATTAALSADTRFAEVDGLELAIYSLGESSPLVCRIFGHPKSLFNVKKSQAEPPSVAFGSSTLGLGLGALGNSAQGDPSPTDFGQGPRYGEFLAVGGAVAQSPRKSHALPDYLLAAGDFVPTAQILYGVKCEGEPSVLIRFSPAETGAQIGLSRVVASALSQTHCRLAGFVILADCAGLVGAQLRQSPIVLRQEGSDRFALPGVRNWLSFSAEQIHRHNLALIVGIACFAPMETTSPLASLLRPIGRNGDILGHFHAAVFPYRPLKKRVLPLEPSVTELFDSGSIEDVLHLLHDDRPLTGLGESELFGGACWLGPIGRVIAEEGA
jgi:anti-anti-sigma factor